MKLPSILTSLTITTYKYSKKTIDIRIWFDSIEIFDSDLRPFNIQTFIDNGKRGWDKLYESGWKTTEVELNEKLNLTSDVGSNRAQHNLVI